MRIIFALLLSFTLSNVACAQQLVGTWKLLSFSSDYGDGSSVEPFGKKPSGYLIITPLRLITVLTSDTRKAGTTADDKVALFNSVISYSGPYRIEGARLVTDVDVSWNQTWTGSKQGRTFSIDGNRLTLVSDRAPSAFDPTKTVSARLVWERAE